MKQHGFTIVEIVITLAIMGVLLTLAVVNVTSTQINARDSERLGDVSSIANHLETFYRTDTTNGVSVGRYPSTALLDSGETSIKALLLDIDLASVTAPGATSVSASFIPATNNVQTVTGVLPQPTKSQYVYQPIQTDGTLCTTEAQECRKYSIFYRTEGKNTVEKVTSKNQ